MLKLFKRLLILIAAVYITAIGWLYFNQRSLLYYPEKGDVYAKGIGFENVEDVYIETVDGERIHAWYNKPAPGKPMFLFFHGNSGHLARRVDKVKQLVDRGYGFLLPAWRGFSNSTGTPSAIGLKNDAKASLGFLQKEGFAPEDIIVIGESLGTGIAVNLATQHIFKGVFLITPYTSIADRAQELYYYIPISYILSDNFDSLSLIKDINAPLLIVHGTSDDIIPHSHSEKLFEAALDPKKLILYPNKGHSDLDTATVFNEMADFFELSRTDTKQ